MARKLTHGTFNKIREDLRNTTDTQAKIASRYGISASTVSWVNITRTWENYLANKKGKSPLRGTVTRPAGKPQSKQIAGVETRHRTSVKSPEVVIDYALRRLREINPCSSHHLALEMLKDENIELQSSNHRLSVLLIILIILLPVSVVIGWIF